MKSVIDAAIVLMARDGLVQEAMKRLVKHLGTLETALTGLVSAAAETPDVANTEEAVHDLLGDIQKYVKVGIWLCQGQTRSMERPADTLVDRRKLAYGEVREEDLALDELLWLDLVDTVVKLVKNVSTAGADLHAVLSSAPPTQPKPIDTAKITTTLRHSVQQTFSALLASTTIPPKQKSTTFHSQSNPYSTRARRTQPQTNPSFLRILRTFLTRATHSSPSLSDLRSVLAEIFSAYTFEETILSHANRFLDKEGFESVREIGELRQRGWRPRGQVCEGCRGRCWGPGTGMGVWEAWEKREAERAQRRVEERELGSDGGKGKGKGKSHLVETEEEGDGDGDVGAEGEVGMGAGSGKGKGKGKGALVVFACRHLWHKSCLEKASSGDGEGGGAVGAPGGVRFTCPGCV